MNQAHYKIKDEIIKYFNQYTNKRLDENTAVNNDIGLTVSEFSDISEFFYKSWKIDLRVMSENIYFIDEVQNPIKRTFSIFKKSKEEDKKRPPLTIGHLIEVVKKGAWFEP